LGEDLTTDKENQRILEDWYFPGPGPNKEFGNVLVHEASLLSLISLARQAERKRCLKLAKEIWGMG
jgi:hypothetical protein